MSRSLEKVTSLGNANNTNPALLACPANHKYEVVLVCVSSRTGTVGATIGTLIGHSAAVTWADFTTTTAANPWGIKFSYEGLVLYAGDWLDVYAHGMGGVWDCTIHYVDVDYT